MAYNENDTMVFKNHKGETYMMKVGEFRNAARDSRNQERDHRPTLVDTPTPNLQTGLDYVQKAVDKDRVMNIQSIGGKEVKSLIDL